MLEDTPLQLFVYDLIEQAELRNKLIDRVDVLNKVKELFLIPKMEMMTSQMVADFYETPISTINNLYARNKNEIDLDGVQTIRCNKLKEFLLSQNEKEGISVNITNRIGASIITLNNMKFDVPNGGTKLFTPRAVLRIGMLLRDSEVAKEVRTQLLKNEKTHSALALYNPPLYSSSRYNHPKGKEMERQGKRDEWGLSSVRDSLDSIISLCYLYWANLG